MSIPTYIGLKKPPAMIPAGLPSLADQRAAPRGRRGLARRQGDPRARQRRHAEVLRADAGPRAGREKLTVL